MLQFAQLVPDIAHDASQGRRRVDGILARGWADRVDNVSDGNGARGAFETEAAVGAARAGDHAGGAKLLQNLDEELSRYVCSSAMVRTVSNRSCS